MGMRQKSATHTGGVARVVKSSIFVVLLSEMVSPVKDSCCDILRESDGQEKLWSERRPGQSIGDSGANHEPAHFRHHLEVSRCQAIPCPLSPAVAVPTPFQLLQQSISTILDSEGKAIERQHKLLEHAASQTQQLIDEATFASHKMQLMIDETAVTIIAQ